METIIIILSLIFLILAWQFIVSPILDGLGGFGRGLIKKLSAAKPPACPACGRIVNITAAKFCPHCGALIRRIS